MTRVRIDLVHLEVKYLEEYALSHAQEAAAAERLEQAKAHLLNTRLISVEHVERVASTAENHPAHSLLYELEQPVGRMNLASSDMFCSGRTFYSPLDRCTFIVDVRAGAGCPLSTCGGK